MVKSKKKKLHINSHHQEHFHAARSVISLMVVLVALAIVMVFYSNQEILLQPGRFEFFMVLATIAMGLLIGLVFLVNQPHPHSKKK